MRGRGERLSVDTVFDSAMGDVVKGLERHGRFPLLKRFVAYGSLLPSFDTTSKNSADPLNDDELAGCVDFVMGHMVTKFQGRLAELLASGAITDLVTDLKKRRLLPTAGRLVLDSGVRCRPKNSSHQGTDGEVSGVEGPDAAYVVSADGGPIAIPLVAEVKSGYVRPADLERQARNHVDALRRGPRLRGRWYRPEQVLIGRTSTGRRVDSFVLRVFVRPSLWRLTREFRLEPSGPGRTRLVMAEQELPATPTTVTAVDRRTWRIRLSWSRDALRSAAFDLVHRYMRLVGEAIARDPRMPLRKDMSAARAGQNDFLHELHIAIFRQLDAEPDRRRREKTMELYNVLAFGWALGHGYRDAKGRITMLAPEYLRRMVARK